LTDGKPNIKQETFILVCGLSILALTVTAIALGDITIGWAAAIVGAKAIAGSATILSTAE
jgi:hypothetical protein